MEQNIKLLQKTIGYSFKDESLLITALTHTSYANEHKFTNMSHNERMEFLGDAVLELTSSDVLYQRYPDMPEGKLTRLRASLVCEPTLAYDAREIHLPDFLRLGKGEEMTGGRDRDSIISDALEAVIGAIYLDSGINEAYKFVVRFVMNDIEDKKLFSDSKTHLQERIYSVNPSDSITYEIVGEAGPDHDKSYEANVLLNNKIIGSGKGKTKKAAHQQAAYNALKTMDKRQ